jgi:hypothetical protein
MSEYSALLSPLAGFYAKDDFLGNDAITDATVGELMWEMVTIGNASTASKLVTTNVGENEHGVLRNTIPATADGDGEVYRFLADTTVLGGAGGYFQFKVRAVTTLAANNFRIGLQDSVTATDPTVGIWVKSDAGVISLCAHSADHGDVTVAAANVPSLTSGTTMVVDTWHTFKVTWGGENSSGGPKSANLYVDGSLAATTSAILIDNDEEMEFSIVHFQDSGGAASRVMDIDFIELFLGRDQ